MPTIDEIAPEIYRISTFERHRETLLAFQQGPLANCLPYTADTKRTLHNLADAEPRVLATMHGTTFRGDGALALRGIAEILDEVYGAR